ncbi:hypothetical protein TGAM01_v209537 [Trichoderma gamsii]|uniref:Uncharacterized protein n=1 Tax=Trichoderma gamsii TaxID=398673 RepID=A0A2P4ZBH3_9HYPO|nr:hypothetical protein TGAM01_v209537 [Trichoderma gamsii]PON21648.1 hypothetical protein TGAM01_v209537 [Trichoderma gamsii]
MLLSLVSTFSMLLAPRWSFRLIRWPGIRREPPCTGTCR